MRLRLLLALLAAPAALPAQQPADTVLRVTGAVDTPLALTLADLAALPQREVTASFRPEEPHRFGGVPLADLLARAGATGKGKRIPQGIVRIEAADGYVAFYALAELDAGFTDKLVLVATAMDGAPLPAKEGPVRLVVPDEKRHGRWVRQVQRIVVVAEPGDGGPGH